MCSFSGQQQHWLTGIPQIMQQRACSFSGVNRLAGSPLPTAMGFESIRFDYKANVDTGHLSARFK
jgi:hypothetical protein